MSDNWLIFVPRDPQWKPIGSVSSAISLATQSFPDAEEIEAKVHDAVQFIDQGQNFDDVFCPICRTSLMESFGELMNNAYDPGIGGFAELQFVTPCCGKPANLNQLDFVATAAFGSFQIDIMNPATGEIPIGFGEALEKELGTTVSAVWCHI